MAKRKQIIKLLDYIRKEYTEDHKFELNDFHMGVLFGLNLARAMIKNKREKEHDF